MNSFLIQCKVRKAELLQFLGITAVGYLIGLIVVFIGEGKVWRQYSTGITG